METRTVRLAHVTMEQAQKALDAMEEIFDAYGLPDQTRFELWEHYQTFACNVLLRFGEFNPEIGHPETNGHG